MAGYVKKIAVIKQVKGGFAADGGTISGLVKAETYAGFLKVEASLINFAPVSEGRYVLGICDGLNTVTFEGLSYEGESDFNLSDGFAFLVCFAKNGIAPIASAACGQMACALPDLKEEMKKRENFKPPKGGVAYDDEAIAEVNYYEQALSDEGGKSVRKDENAKKEGNTGGENEAHSRPVEVAEKGGVESAARILENDIKGGLAGGDFYARMRGDIERIFTTYPKDEELERAMEGSRFARISYGGDKYYVFGVLTVDGVARYVCYGVPARGRKDPPPSLKECATLFPTESGGYFMTYQDAGTGVSVKLNNV